jgi:hypothetical protein
MNYGDGLNCTPESKSNAIGISRKDGKIFSTLEENKNAAEETGGVQAQENSAPRQSCSG